MPSSHSSKHTSRSSNGHRPHVVPTSERTDRPARPSNFRTSLTNTPDPILYGMSIIIVIFGITFLIVGSVHTKNCGLQPLLPIWLLVMGLILSIGGTWLYFIIMRMKKEPFRTVQFIEKFVSIALLLIFLGWFIAGNAFVFKAWKSKPDYGHYWFSIGCDKSVFFLSFVAIIVLDALVGLAAIGLCFLGVTKIIVKE